jgi:hypothetical protein
VVKMGTVWDRTAEFLSDNIGAVLPLALIAFFVPASIEGNFEAARQGATPGFVLALQLIQLAFGILSVWGSLAIAAMALDMGDAQAAGAIARRRLVPALVVSVAMLLAAMLLVLPVAIFLQLSGYDMVAIALGRDFSFTPATAGVIALYFLALGALLLWLSARLAVVTPVIVREPRMFGALARSWELTRGVAWRIVGVLLLYMFVAGVAYLAAQTVFGSVFALVTGGSPSGGFSLAGVLTSIVTAAVQTGFTVILPAFAAKLYLALTTQPRLREDMILV